MSIVLLVNMVMLWPFKSTKISPVLQMFSLGENDFNNSMKMYMFLFLDMTKFVC